ncbi:DUF4870 domain-containing protein [Candidatus Micrarchaeota archaeon]|nr:DUF4870 domain-containing protein [Candidatus Micrarchaeota archaeon]MBU1165615.1 DUF4870 domain-containing protein [Candidatus Micrarchaeota archaeon]MBU1886444.1 DUF4870 domain-containing protein [Candidatus Micrarchaeota archaeon]
MAGKNIDDSPKTGSSAGMTDDSKLFGALAYLLTFITGIVMLFVKKEDAYVKFHAMQSILLGVAMIVVNIIMAVVGGVATLIPGIGWIVALVVGLVSGVISLGFLILWLLLMWKAYKGEKWKLPIIGAQAEKLAVSVKV